MIRVKDMRMCCAQAYTMKTNKCTVFVLQCSVVVAVLEVPGSVEIVESGGLWLLTGEFLLISFIHGEDTRPSFPLHALSKRGDPISPWCFCLQIFSFRMQEDMFVGCSEKEGLGVWRVVSAHNSRMRDAAACA